MKKINKSKLVGAILISLLPAIVVANTMSNDSMSTSSNMIMMKSNHQYSAFGEIIGDFNSPDGEVVGATLPGQQVTFFIPKIGESEYLHFAVMHAESGNNGWFFAPKSAGGIKLSGKIGDITNQIGLFSAPKDNELNIVKASIGEIIYGPTNKFLTVTVNTSDEGYNITIKNISNKKYETPISSGVWTVTSEPVTSFDHMSSSALHTLATSGHRTALYDKISRLSK